MSYTFTQIVLWYFIIMAFGYLILLFGSFFDVFNKFREMLYGNIGDLVNLEHAIPVTVIIPTYNKEQTIIDTTDSILKSTYKNLFVIIVNDGSSDNTLSLLKTTYHLKEIVPMLNEQIPTAKINHVYISETNPNLRVIDKVHSAKGDSLNVGLSAAQTPFIMTMDADSIAEEKAIENSMYTLLSRPHTIAVGGSVYVLNGCEYEKGRLIKMRLPKSPVAAFQANEYLRAFLFARSGWDMFNGALVYAGTNTLFEKESLMEVGGFVVDNPSEDAEIILQLREFAGRKKRPSQLRFTSTSAVWTVVPSTLKAFWKQRVSWQMGVMQSFFPYLRMLFNPRYGLTGLITYPFYFFFEMFGCLVELSMYFFILISWLLGTLSVTTAWLTFLISLGFLCFLTLASTAMNFLTFNKYNFLKNGFYMLALAFLELFGFRQFFVLASLYGIMKYIAKKVRLRLTTLGY